MRQLDLVCYSHLRWTGVYQRPQHLLSRAARAARVLFVEEPFPVDGRSRMYVDEMPGGVVRAVAELERGLSAHAALAEQRRLIARLLDERDVKRHVAWLYTPMALEWMPARHPPVAVVYDCMDDLAHFTGAPSAVRRHERELIARADVVFAGGRALWEARRGRRPDIGLFPSSVDAEHFRAAGTPLPADVAALPRPRIGYVGVVDERIDVDLLGDAASLRPDWSFVMVGPRTKIDSEALPAHDNVHYLGARAYDDLPAYLHSFDVAMMPFARNAATRFISPTKTLEYLAAGRPVVSTSIRDVVSPYGERGLARIADTPAAFVGACEEAMEADADEHAARAAAHVATTSWDATFRAMWDRVEAATARASRATAAAR